jgi:hypothetical protein
LNILLLLAVAVEELLIQAVLAAAAVPVDLELILTFL